MATSLPFQVPASPGREYVSRLLPRQGVLGVLRIPAGNPHLLVPKLGWAGTLWQLIPVCRTHCFALTLFAKAKATLGQMHWTLAGKQLTVH